MAADQFVIDGVCHPYNFSEENLKGRFGRIFKDVLYAFHPLLKNLGTPRRYGQDGRLPRLRGRRLDDRIDTGGRWRLHRRVDAPNSAAPGRRDSESTFRCSAGWA